MKTTAVLHRKEFDLDDLVERDLVDETLIGRAVEDYVWEWCLKNGVDPNEVDYRWSCWVAVEILKDED